MSAATADTLYQDIERNGFGILREAIPGWLLDQAAQEVRAELAATGAEYFCHLGQERLARTSLGLLGQSAAFHRLLAALQVRAGLPPGREERILPVLRVLSGAAGQRHSHRFHFDAYLVTALLPIIIPPGPEAARGTLVIYPNRRPVRRSLLANLAEKAAWQNPVAARALAAPWVQRRLGGREMPTERGHLYLFWGYRSLHANRPCPADVVRATALFHFADPHAASPLLRRLEARHHRQEGVAQPVLGRSWAAAEEGS
ncbi:hypothetical protein [Siccirubricoccus phaeus]|uniref:hypothetical protein n=1 Tax=Siccirubricoccus phaeus TaxID=2595053 RepID=UPI0011F33D1F|nr:hypothetical protein [Siccirubricoccus phaeus]